MRPDCIGTMYLYKLNIINYFSRSSIFYKGSDAEGFHLSSGLNFLYPSNFPVREYQMNIIKTALFNNTLVSLPTGNFVLNILIIYYSIA